jgi:hypothetical protein
MSCWLVKSLTLVALAVAIAPGRLGAQETVSRHPSNAPPSAERLEAWSEQLSADEFLVRESAMLNLVAAGQAAIPVVKKVLTRHSLEAVSRALHVLQQLGLSADVETQEAARAALVEATAHKESPAVARRAADVLAQLVKLRSAQALSELEALGAKVVRSQSFNGAAIEDVVESVQIESNFKGNDADLRRLKWLAAGRLVLVGQRASDAWLAQAAEMSELEQLHLYQAGVTDDGLAAFAEHPYLRQIGVYYTPITAKGLAHLEKLPLLGFIKLYGTKVPAEAIEKFQAAAGVAKVDHRKGAFLGVGCLPTDNACVLSTVHADTPAEKAGLVADDVILRFGDTKVDSFETLTARIAELDSGDKVEVEVLRQIEDDEGRRSSKRVIAEVTLAPWELKLAVENGYRP